MYKEDRKINIGEFLRKVREEMEVSQEQMAYEMGTRQATISDIETGKVRPRIRQLAHLYRMTGRTEFMLYASRLSVIEFFESLQQIEQELRIA